jgi:hypothetical protein
MNSFRLTNNNFSNQKFNEGPLLVVACVLACFALSPMAQAILPAPDGGYPGFNTAEGTDALFSLTTGERNTATGAFALYDNINGADNTAIGQAALVHNTTGDFNTATGSDALGSNTSGIQNVAIGVAALGSNTTGRANTASGNVALAFNLTGNNNTAVGRRALLTNTTGNSNIAVGFEAGQNLTTGDNNIDVGNQGVAGESDTIRIGTQGTQTATFIAGVFEATVAKGVGVVLDSNGQLGTKGSSERFKDAIKPMDKASEAIHALKPVTFHYKKEIDPDSTPQFGLVAEDVEKVNPDLVARDANGKPYTVRYDAVNAMLLNEFLKEHRTVQELKSTVADQEAAIAQQQNDFQSKLAEQQKQIKALTTGLEEQASQIQKVSAQIEASKPAPQMVGNNR